MCSLIDVCFSVFSSIIPSHCVVCSFFLVICVKGADSLSAMPSMLWRRWLGGRKGARPVKKLSGGGASVVICLERGADLRTARLMPLPLTVSCFSEIIGFTFLVPADPGSPGQRPLNGCVCVCVCVCWCHLHFIKGYLTWLDLAGARGTCRLPLVRSRTSEYRGRPRYRSGRSFCRSVSESFSSSSSYCSSAR